jgi:hypothetical protein
MSHQQRLLVHMGQWALAGASVRRRQLQVLRLPTSTQQCVHSSHSLARAVSLFSLQPYHMAVQRLSEMTDRVHVPQMAAAVPEGVRLQERQRCIMGACNETPLHSTCPSRLDPWL